MWNVTPYLLTLSLSWLVAKFSSYPLLVFWSLISSALLMFDYVYGCNHDLIRRPSNTSLRQWLFKSSSHWFISVYRQYGKYDLRYLMSDPVIVTVSQLELIVGILTFYAVLTGSKTLYIMSLTSQIYGTSVYFWSAYGLDVLRGWPVLLNVLWIVVPLYFLFTIG
jgi:hypothetical protein